MDLDAQKEAFSHAHIYAIASAAGFAHCKPSPDEDSVDLTLCKRGGMGTFRSPKIDLQLKSYAAAIPTGSDFSFRLKRKNYEDLTPNTCVPRILVVVFVPHSVSDWVSFAPGEMSLRRKAYWVSLWGMPPSTNKTTINIRIPCSQEFNPQSLSNLMARIESGSRP